MFAHLAISARGCLYLKPKVNSHIYMNRFSFQILEIFQKLYSCLAFSEEVQTNRIKNKMLSEADKEKVICVQTLLEIHLT